MNKPPVLFDQFGQPLRPSAFNSVYDGARVSRARSYLPNVASDSRDTLNSYTRRTLLSHARWLFVNVGFVKGAIRDIARYSVGTGIRVQSQISDTEVRKLYEDFWNQWCKIPEVTGKFNFREVLNLVSVAIDVDGDHGIILTETQGGFPQIQLVESHRIESEATDESFFDGVKTDRAGRPLLYRIREGKETFRTIPNVGFHLAYDPDRCDELRGKSALHHAVNNLRDQLEILIAEKQGVKLNSGIATVIKSSAGDATEGFFGKTATSGDSTNGYVTQEQIFSGAIPRLQPGEDIWAFKSDRPSATFQGFLDYLARDAAVGLGVPVEFLWDAAKLGGTSNRFILQKAQRRFEERQCTLIKLATRIYGYVVSKAVKRGDLPYSEEWWKVRWQTPSKITVDVGREAQANRDDLLIGNRTFAEDFAERGLDWQDERDQSEVEALDLITRADRLAKATGKPFEFCISLLQQRTPNGNMPIQQPAKPEPKEIK